MKRPQPADVLAFDDEGLAALQQCLSQLFGDISSATPSGDITIASPSQGALLYVASGLLAQLADVATGNVLLSGGLLTRPAWGKVNLTTHVSAILAAVNGGTGIGAYAIGDLLYASGAAALAQLADIATGAVLVSGGVGVAPAWSRSPTVDWLNWAGQKRTTGAFNAAASTALANITGLSVTVTGGRTYGFQATLFVDADAVGGSKFAIGGTATATAIVYQIELLDNATAADTIVARQTALGGSSGQVGTTSGLARVTGTITVNAGGTLTAQFAQLVASGTSTVLAGSQFVVDDIL